MDAVYSATNLIYVVSHKPYDFPHDKLFLPIKVGCSSNSIADYFISDDSGDNISHLNSSFCELTALYWIWKNSNANVIGVAHYRRYFSSRESTLKLKGKKIASCEELSGMLDNFDIIVPKPRNYFIFNIRSHYLGAHYKSDYDLLRNEIEKISPDYIHSFDTVMKGTKICLYNMFFCKKAVIDDYFCWLFQLLLSLEKKIDYSAYDSYQKRVFGFMSERLFNVWLHKNQDAIKIKYLPVVNLEGENLLRKGFGLIKRHLNIWK